ncbi:MAG: hypothetical protein ACLQIB_47510 [Isosphaeraceae bacterium]
MLKQRLLAAPGNRALLGAVTLFAASLAAATYPGARSRLVASEMSGSRGSHFFNNTLPCNALENLAACTQVNVPCNTCGPTSAGQTFQAAAGAGCQVDPGAAGHGNCNNIYNGTCLQQVVLICSTTAPGGGKTQNACTIPPGPPPVEPE